MDGLAKLENPTQLLNGRVDQRTTNGVNHNGIHAIDNQQDGIASADVLVEVNIVLGDASGGTVVLESGGRPGLLLSHGNFLLC